MRRFLTASICIFFLAACAGGSHDPYSAVPIEKYYAKSPPAGAGTQETTFVVPDGDVLYVDFNSREYEGLQRIANTCIEKGAATAAAENSISHNAGAQGGAVAGNALAGQATQADVMMLNVESHTAALGADALQGCAHARNIIIDDYLRVSDLACQAHLDAIQGTSAAVNSGLTVTTNVATALATFVTGSVAVKELTALANVASSSRSVVNEQVYFQALAPQITRLIREDRKQSRATIVANIKLPIEQYTLDQALADLSAYHSACSFAAALEQISQAVANPSVTPAKDAQKPDAPAPAKPAVADPQAGH